MTEKIGSARETYRNAAAISVEIDDRINDYLTKNGSQYPINEETPKEKDNVLFYFVRSMNEERAKQEFRVMRDIIGNLD